MDLAMSRRQIAPGRPTTQTETAGENQFHGLTKASWTENKQARMDSKKKFRLQPEWFAAILITAAAAALHFYYWRHIGGLWRDEVNLINLSGRPSLGEMERDSFPILMPLLLHGWLAAGMGDSDLHLRLIGLLTGLGMLVALWVSSWKVRRVPPLLGLVLLGLNSTAVFFGDSLRAYGLGTVFAVILTASAFFYLQKPSLRRAAWLALWAVLSVQVLYHNAVLVAAVCFGAWTVCWRRSDPKAAIQILCVALLAAASLLPYLHIFISSGGAAALFRTGVELRRFFWSYDDTLGYPFSGFIYVWAFLGLIIIARAGAGLLKPRPAAAQTDNSQDDFSLFAAVTLIIALVGFPVFFWRAQMPMQSWYVLPFLACAVVCFDAALPVFPGLLRGTFVGLATGTALVSTLTTANLLSRQFSNVHLYATELADDASAKDYILVSPWIYGITFGYYFHGTTPWDTIPPISDHSIHRLDLVLADMENTNAMAPVFHRIARTLESGHRIWFLTLAGTPIPAPGIPAPASLPPPPLKYSGWSESPYSVVWTSQTLQFIADHSARFGEFKYSSLTGYITENMDLYVADGWRTNMPAALK